MNCIYNQYDYKGLYLTIKQTDESDILINWMPIIYEL